MNEPTVDQLEAEVLRLEIAYQEAVFAVRVATREVVIAHGLGLYDRKNLHLLQRAESKARANRLWMDFIRAHDALADKLEAELPVDQTIAICSLCGEPFPYDDSDLRKTGQGHLFCLPTGGGVIMSASPLALIKCPACEKDPQGVP